MDRSASRMPTRSDSDWGEWPLAKLFRPRAIAVVGATSKPGKVGRIVFDLLRRTERPVYPVHPTQKTLLGHDVIPRVEDLPEGVDVAVITVNAGQAVQAATDCGHKGIPFIIVVAGGFSEVGAEGRILEDKLRAVVATTGSRILGPNSLGIFVPRERIDTIFVEHGDRALAGGGGVAFITQSGSVGTEGLGVASNIGFGLRAFVGLGNKVDLNELDFLRYFGDDDRTNCIMLYMENFSDGRAFLEIAGQVSRKKPVVVLKAGRTAAGAAAASSHTGRLAGSDRVVSGAFRQFCIQRVFDEEQLCDAARVLAGAPLPRGPRVAVISSGGGYGVMAADYIESRRQRTRLQMAHLSPDTEAKLRAIVPGFASVANPVDLTASATDEMTGDTLRIVTADDGVDAVICVALFAPPGISDALVAHTAAVAADVDKPIVVVGQFGPFTDGLLRRFYDNGVIGYPCVARAVRAVRTLVERAEFVHTMEGTP